MPDSADDRSPRESRGSDHLIGSVLASRYQIESRLGEGAMGTVYKAKHVKVGRAFAVKVLHSKLLADNKVAQRFEREAELAGRLRHPNVIGVVDVGETPDGLHYMVMDFAEGPDLATLMTEAPFPGPRIVHMVRQLLEGLYHAHEQGLIHRDFKPENVIIEKDSHGAEMPRIVDFGIAILREGGDSTDGEGRLTTNGLVLGTPHYMAPEQAVADPIDHRIDLFALGIVIYEMLCGQLPFDGTGAEVARANLLLDPPVISVRVPYLEVDPLLEAFARRLMEKKRDRRFTTAKAARELLDLIEKDRAAAALVLGVPVERTRGPALTAPSAPQPRHLSVDDGGTFPPPYAPAPAEPAPLVAAPRAQSTISVEPLDRKKRPLGAIIGFGAALLVGGIVFAATRGSDKAPPAPVAVSEPEPVKPLEPAIVVPPDAVVEVVVPPDAAAVVIDKPIDKKPLKDPKPTQAKIIPPGPGSAVKPVEVKPIEVKPIEVKPVEVKPAGPLDANGLAALYKQVGSELRNLGEDSAPFNRWRIIRIFDAIKTPDSIAKTEVLLRQLRAEGVALKKSGN